jgi:anti-sigma-K factor RskA
MPDDSTFDPTLEPDLVEIEALLRDLDEDDLVLEAPPAAIWSGIQARLGDEHATTMGDAPVEAEVVPFRRRHAWALPALAAAAVVLVAIGAVIVFVGGGSDPTTLATAELVFDPASFDPAGAEAAATALLLDDDGDDVVEIDEASLPFGSVDDASLELWMIRVDAGEIVDMVSLGAIDPDGTRDFTVPPGYDPDVYSVIDISIEPHDGDQTHSGRSILRGELGPI